MTINPYLLRPDLYARLLLARRHRRRERRIRREVTAAFVRTFKRHGRRVGAPAGQGPAVFVAASAADALHIAAENRALWAALGVVIESSSSALADDDRTTAARTLAIEFRKRETLIYAESAQDSGRGLGQLAAAMPPGAVARIWHGAADHAAHRLFQCIAPIGAVSPFAHPLDWSADGAATPETESE